MGHEMWVSVVFKCCYEAISLCYLYRVIDDSPVDLCAARHIAARNDDGMNIDGALIHRESTQSSSRPRRLSRTPE